MIDNRSDREKLFPSDPSGRLVLGLVSLVLCPVFGVVATKAILAKPQDHLAICMVLIGGEIAGLLSLFFATGLIWALAKPRWLEGFLNWLTLKINRTMHAVILLCLIPLIAVLCLVFWDFAFRK
jgi:hypothetical protein